MKYSDCLADWLKEMGYTHCFYVGGGNIMHLLESLSRKLSCHAVIHEVAAGIAAEYFNETSNSGKALALVTAGPGLTNIVTALGGAYLESRELLVIGGQVKTADLARGKLRQRGIQEIDGVGIARPVTVCSVLMDAPVDFDGFSEIVEKGTKGRKGPVFIEIPLDVQAREVGFAMPGNAERVEQTLPCADLAEVVAVAEEVRLAQRPVFLIGGGITRATASRLVPQLESQGVPVATTWNGADRLPADCPIYVGRPNTWGQRSANLILQQADLVVVFGSRLGLQQTGFNWQSFVPGGKVIQIEIDAAEVAKGHPRIERAIIADANDFLSRLLSESLGEHQSWLNYARQIRGRVPRIENVNKTADGYISPYVFVDQLSVLCEDEDVVIPCSSGGAFTVMMQIFAQKKGQRIVTNKGLASMGYGLSGAIGAAFANPESRVVLVEGDGGFAQNIQEIGTVATNRLNLKMFVFDDAGYASIRMTQRSYFGGRYVGCDRQTGLGLPDWEKLFEAWGVPALRVSGGYAQDNRFLDMFNNTGPAAFIVSIDPEQTYFPKITSRITASGAMESNPIHRMTPDLDQDLMLEVTKFIKD